MNVRGSEHRRHLGRVAKLEARLKEDKTHEIKAVEGGPKLVHVTFNMNEGPKVKIKRVEFTGNTEISDGKLRKRMKDNRAQWAFSWITGRGTYQETKFEEDAERVMEYYRDHGYIRAQVGERPHGTIIGKIRVVNYAMILDGNAIS